jgi:hypothetical protein
VVVTRIQCLTYLDGNASVRPIGYSHEELDDTHILRKSTNSNYGKDNTALAGCRLTRTHDFILAVCNEPAGRPCSTGSVMAKSCVYQMKGKYFCLDRIFVTGVRH